MTEAEMLFNQAFIRNQKLWAAISTFRDSLVGVSDAVSQRQRAQIEGMYDRLAFDPAYQRFLVNPKGFAEKVDRAKFVDTAAKGAMENTMSSLDAAVVVFAHSVLDAAAIDYCRVTAAAAPNDWEQDLKDSKVSLLETAKANYGELLRKKLDDHINKLERESLLVKIDRLLARCKPSAKSSPMENYEFNMGAMERLDEQRHQIVHGGAFGSPLKVYPISQESLWYLLQTAMYFGGLVNLRYGVKIDPEYVRTLFEPQKQ